MKQKLMFVYFSDYWSHAVILSLIKLEGQFLTASSQYGEMMPATWCSIRPERFRPSALICVGIGFIRWPRKRVVLFVNHRSADKASRMPFLWICESLGINR